MKAILNDREYNVYLDSNVTVDAIVKKLPLQLSLTRYAGHEYYAELPFKPAFANDRTSQIKAGHIYYWDGWNAFVINFGDADISPYKVVHIGKIEDGGVSDILAGSGETVNVEVK